MGLVNHSKQIERDSAGRSPRRWAARALLAVVPAVAAAAFAVGCQGQSPSQPSKPGPAAPSTPAAKAPAAAEDPTGAREVTVEATNFKYEPAEIKAAPGEKLKVTLVNKGESGHSIGIRLPSGDKELEKIVAAGKSGSMIVTAPDKEGSYPFYCPVGNHEDKGMKGSLVVKAK